MILFRACKRQNVKKYAHTNGDKRRAILRWGFSPRDGDDPTGVLASRKSIEFSPRDGDDPPAFLLGLRAEEFSPRDGDDPRGIPNDLGQLFLLPA